MKAQTINREMPAKRGQRRLYAAVLLGTLIWCILIFLPPLLASIGGTRLAPLIKLFFAPLCHQSADRSFLIGGVPLAVCARCTGIYLGFLAGVLAIPFLHRSRFLRRRWPQLNTRRMLLAGAALMGIEFLLTHSLLPPLDLLRALSGTWFGAVMALLTLISLFELQGRQILSKRNQNG